MKLLRILPLVAMVVGALATPEAFARGGGGGGGHGGGGGFHGGGGGFHGGGFRGAGFRGAGFRGGFVGGRTFGRFGRPAFVGERFNRGWNRGFNRGFNRRFVRNNRFFRNRNAFVVAAGFPWYYPYADYGYYGYNPYSDYGYEGYNYPYDTGYYGGYTPSYNTGYAYYPSDYSYSTLPAVASYNQPYYKTVRVTRIRTTTHTGCLAPVAAGSTTANVQIALRNNGFDPGPIDGILGPQTRCAISSFQASHCLAVTGGINGSLLSALGTE